MTARADGTGVPSRWQIIRGHLAGWVLGQELWRWLRRHPELVVYQGPEAKKCAHHTLSHVVVDETFGYPAFIAAAHCAGCGLDVTKQEQDRWKMEVTK